MKTWAQKYRDQGLVVIGVLAPEFASERNVDIVKKAVPDLGIDYPVTIDNKFAIWRASNSLLAGALFHRRQGRYPLSPLRRRPLCKLRAGDSATACRRRPQRRGCDGDARDAWHLRGIKEALSRYRGGAAGTAQIDRLSEGDTGHAESVRMRRCRPASCCRSSFRSRTIRRN